MHRDSVLAAALVLAVTSSAVRWWSTSVGYLATVAVVVVLVVTTLRDGDGRLPIRARPAIFVPVVGVWVILVAVALVHPTVAAVKRVPTFIAGSAVFLFVVPAVLPRAAIERAIAVVAGAAVLVSLPGMLTGRYWIGPLLFPVGGLLVDVPGIDGIFAAKAIFASPNYLALLALFGLLGTLRHVRANEHWSWTALAVLSAAGLAFTVGRAALLALVICVALAAIYSSGGRRAFTASLGGVVVVAAGCVLVVVLAPDVWRSVGPSLSGRDVLWSTTARLVADNPLVGWGFQSPRPLFAARIPLAAVPGDRMAGSIHNSYIRLFFIGGIPGGLAYLAVVGGVLWTIATRLRTDADIWLVLPAIAALVVHVFNASTIFGLSMPSVLAALFVGYAQPRSADRVVALPVWVRRGIQEHVRF